VLSGWSDELADDPVFTVTRDPRNEAGQPIPRLLVGWQDGPPATELVAAALAGDPSTAVVSAGPYTIGITPETVADDEVGAVVPAIRSAWHHLTGTGRP